MRYMDVTRNTNTLDDKVPVRNMFGRRIGSEYDPAVQRENALSVFLTNVHDKVVKLENGEPDSKKKAKLIEIATRNLDNYFSNGGSERGSIQVTDKKTKITEIVTVTELQKRLEAYTQN